MELDEKLCLCFHVTKRKVVNYIRIEKPRRAAQLSDCYGAGTGCGWCRPFLVKLFEAAQQNAAAQAETQPPGAMDETASATSSPDPLPGADDYARLRADYVKQGKGSPPPGATPID